MITTFWQTMTPPPLVIFSRRPRPVVIKPYDARRTRTVKRGRSWLARHFDLAHVAAVALTAAGVVIAEDIGQAILTAVSPPPAYQFGGAS